MAESALSNFPRVRRAFVDFNKRAGSAFCRVRRAFVDLGTVLLTIFKKCLNENRSLLIVEMGHLPESTILQMLSWMSCWKPVFWTVQMNVWPNWFPYWRLTHQKWTINIQAKVRLLEEELLYDLFSIPPTNRHLENITYPQVII